MKVCLTSPVSIMIIFALLFSTIVIASAVKNDEEVKNAIYNFNPTLLKDILNKVIFYFEDKEEYEKCAFLLNIQHISKYYLEN